MKIDTEHLHYWMRAIRESSDPLRTLDAFWQGQISSKEWLIENLSNVVNAPGDIDIYGGWVGVLASMIFQSNIPVRNIRSIDIDPDCEKIATMMNKGEEINGRFSAITADMCDTESVADIVINTSCEHVSQQQFEIWKNKISSKSLILLQSNDYDIPEHIRTANSLEEFKDQSQINVIWEGEKQLLLYKRFMLIGYKQ
jgi:hypothetical protein